MDNNMKKMLIYVFILFAIVFGWKLIKGAILKYEQHSRLTHRVITVSAIPATTTMWQPSISVVGSTRTVKGVNVTAELEGMITAIHIKPGNIVHQGDLLVEQDIAPDLAKLAALKAEALFAKITYDRNLLQYKAGAISQETLAGNKSQFDSTTANVQQEEATINQKRIKAPFTGRLGISLVNPGQYLRPGDTIVNLQTLSPIYVDFYLPQQHLTKVEVGMPVTVTADTYKKRTFNGKITTINPMVEDDVRNVEVEATLPNKDESLLPGMFVNVNMNTGKQQKLITLPQTAITFNPYGNIAYTLEKTKEKQKNQPIWTAKQIFVTVGDSRGNQIAVLSGIKEGDMVVTSGQLKLTNGAKVVIDNSLEPSDNPNPHPPEE